MPFGADFLCRDWPLLLECCSIPCDHEKIKSLASEIIDNESLVCTAEAHGVIGHVATALAEVSDPLNSSSLLDLIRERHRVHVLSTLGLTAELLRMLELFRQSAIEAVVIKGPVLSLRAYGHSAARQFADIDCLVRDADIQHAAAIFTSAGYQSRISAAAIHAGKIPGEYRFRRDGTNIIFELHTERTLRYFPSPLPIEQFLQSKAGLPLDGYSVPALSPEHEFVLISVHGATHFWERLMWIADIAAFVHNHPRMDWNRVLDCAADVRAQRMLRLALLLAERLLRMPVPAALQKYVTHDSMCERLAREVESWLPYAGYAPPSLAQRAKFRFRMPGRLLAGATYLARLSFSPTEDDWTSGSRVRGSTIAEILRRPLRLARKYRSKP